MTRYAMLIDLRRCIGCHTCSIACKVENGVSLGAFRTWVKMVERGSYPRVKRFFLPLGCNNCDDPVCVAICPIGATWQRDDGIVVVEEDQCIGCKFCLITCPYTMRSLDPLTQSIQKCDFCRPRIDRGEEPVCVESCLGKARIFGDLADPQSRINILLSEQPLQTLRADGGGRPSVYYLGADLLTLEI